MYTFKNQDEAFLAWVRAHPNGLIVNVSSMRLHHPHCGHMSDFRTRSAKACADGSGARTELQDWAFQTNGQELEHCQTCEA